MVFNATFNNISVISSWPVLLVKKTGEHKKKSFSSSVNIRKKERF
jgi:hypothetical protein